MPLKLIEIFAPVEFFSKNSYDVIVYLHPQSLPQSQGLQLQGAGAGAAQPVQAEVAPNATVIFSLGLTEVTLLPLGSTR